jgi:glucan-binding YG repeat protein
MKKTFIFIGLIFILSVSVFAQTKKKTTSKKTTKKTPTTTAVVTQPPSNEPVTVTPTPTPPKKNERPDEQPAAQTDEPKKKNQTEKNAASDQKKEVKYPFVYEFSQPNFVIKTILIEHDESGKGKITFEHRDFGEPISDPLQLSQITLEKLNKLFTTLNFLDSTEDYQSPMRDYGHLGNHKVIRRKDDKERIAKYNWTENKDAKALADEYRKIGEQFIWYFDISVARENQPLEAPSLMDRLDSLLKRDEISDPSQMLPLLKELSNDERIPLIARNKATRIIKEIEKKAEKSEK